jgi:hypothetical protein
MIIKLACHRKTRKQALSFCVSWMGGAIANRPATTLLRLPEHRILIGCVVNIHTVFLLRLALM